MRKEINDYAEKINTYISRTGIRELHITAGDTLIAHITTRKDALSAADAERLASELISSGLSGLIIKTGDSRSVTYGNASTRVKLLHYTYSFSPLSFIQNNRALNCKTVEFVRDRLSPLKGKTILDLYAGAGNFSLPLAEEAEVLAVEGNAHAIEDGRRNAESNGVEVEFVRSSAEDFIPEKHFDTVILDPPRPGVSSRAMRTVMRMRPERIVYLSCNPATFSRDLHKLHSTYDIESVRVIDFFPQTFHIETLAFLRLR